MEKFECSMCGKCCRELKGFKLSDERQKEIFLKERDDMIKNTPLYTFQKPEDEGMALYEWEVTRLKDIASAKGFDLKIKPRYGMLSNMGTVIVVTWMLDYDICPFLENNKCSIYKNRPLICQAFPFYKTIYDAIKTDKKLKSLEIGPLSCPKRIEMKELSGTTMMFGQWKKTMYEVYGETFIGSSKSDFIKVFDEELIEELVRRGHIDLRKLDTQTFLRKYENRSISMYQFAVRKNIISQKDVDDLPIEVEKFGDITRENAISFDASKAPKDGSISNTNQ